MKSEIALPVFADAHSLDRVLLLWLLFEQPLPPQQLVVGAANFALRIHPSHQIAEPEGIFPTSSRNLPDLGERRARELEHIGDLIQRLAGLGKVFPKLWIFLTMRLPVSRGLSRQRQQVFGQVRQVGIRWLLALAVLHDF